MPSDELIQRGNFIACSTFLIICFALVTILPLYYAGYGPEKEKIGNYEETKCLITGYDGPVNDVCHESCNCVCVPTKNGCVTTCQTCAYDCYDGFVFVQFNTSDGDPYGAKIQIANDKRASHEVLEKFKKYKIGSKHKCFYDNTNPSEGVVFRVDYEKLQGTLAGIIIFSFMTGCFCICLIGICVLISIDWYRELMAEQTNCEQTVEQTNCETTNCEQTNYEKSVEMTNCNPPIETVCETPDQDV